MKKLYCLLIILASSFLIGEEISDKGLQTLYHALDPGSVSEHMALYQLYPQTEMGQKALRDAWKLLNPSSTQIDIQDIYLPENIFSKLCRFISGETLSFEKSSYFESEINLIDKLASNLANRKLQGFQVTSERALLKLPEDEIDIARAVLLSELGNSSKSLEQIRMIEAMLDMMALQIKATLSENSSPQSIIAAINNFIFDKQHFRFPSIQEHEKTIDQYTFLPSVITQKRGVCLGVSILYLAIAQRLDLELIPITPPGHIFISYRKDDEIINIETTCRGVDLEDKIYANINYPKLVHRTLKEVVGMAQFNLASHYITVKQDYPKAIQAYEKALKYLPDDCMVLELLACAHYLNGKREKAYKILKRTQSLSHPLSLYKDPLSEDILYKRCDAEALELVISHIDNSFDAIENKILLLKETLEQYPRFLSGLFMLAGLQLEIGYHKDALTTLERYHEQDNQNPQVEFLLAHLYFARNNYPKAYIHLQQTKSLIKAKSDVCKEIEDFENELNAVYLIDIK